LIWASIGVDLGSITEDNVDDWVFRLALIQKIDGAYMRLNGKPLFLVREHVERRIGLRVNVVNMTKTKWINKLLNNRDINVIDRNHTKMNKELLNSIDKKNNVDEFGVDEFGMYSEDGNAAVLNYLNDNPDVKNVDEVCKAIAKDYPEVYDTVVREAIQIFLDNRNN
jgi:urate oxidase